MFNFSRINMVAVLAVALWSVEILYRNFNFPFGFWTYHLYVFIVWYTFSCNELEDIKEIRLPEFGKFLYVTLTIVWGFYKRYIKIIRYLKNTISQLLNI